MTVNRYAAGCSFCSLDVLPGGGRLLQVEGAWHVACRNCYEQDRASSRGIEPPPIPFGPPPGCRPTILLRVLGLHRECWKCGEMTSCVGALYPDRHAAEIDSLIACGEGEPLDVAHDPAGRRPERPKRNDPAALQQDRVQRLPIQRVPAL